MNEVTNKTALITGASSGFGLEFAKLFAADGCNLVLTAKTSPELSSITKKIEEQYRVKVIAHAIDLAQPFASQKLGEWVEEQNIHVNYLINNAGVGNYGRFGDNSLEREHELLELNVIALSELCHFFLPKISARGGGRILNVSSLAAFQPGPYYATYFASKSYVLLFSEALAIEYVKDNVSITVLCPGVSPTGFFERAEMANTSKLLKNYFLKPEAVALAGYRGLLKGELIVVPGVRNKLLSRAYRIMPRTTIAKITSELIKIAARG